MTMATSAGTGTSSDPQTDGRKSDEDLAPLLDAAVEALGGQTRPGQIAMARAVAAALDDRAHLLVQAGTGTGKSLAYLVPALAHHKRVIVATATLALQRQLVAVDLPRLAGALKPLIGREPAFALLKGRNNYVCLNKVEGGQADDEMDSLFEPSALGKLGQEVLRVRDWVEETETGDRDDLSPGVSDRAWGQVSVSARECLGSKCPYVEDCFAEHAKELARSADVVVTNHALLAIAAMDSDVQVLPEHDAVIVDEAHELVNRVTSAATGELTRTAVERAHHRADKLLKESTGANLGVATLDFNDALENVPEGRYNRGIPEELGMALAQLRDASREAMAELGKSRKNDGPEGDAARKQARAANEQVFGVAERILAGSDDDVVWLERSEFRGNKVSTLKIAPLGIDTLLRFKMFARTPVVLTSATLKLGGDFNAVAASVGLHPNERIELDFVPQLPAELYDAAVKMLRDGDTDGEEFLDQVQNLPQHWRALDVGSPRPDDPVSAARTEAVSRQGGNGFMAVSASHAALLMAQGAGRLIRAMDDRGVVAVLDSRLATKPYGGFLRSSMPAFWPTDDTDRVLRSLRAIDAMAKVAEGGETEDEG
jgi:ATP-dependent DNA helicase DinG